MPILAFPFQRHPGTPITELNSLASTAVPATKHPRPICFSQMCQRQHEGCTHQWTDPQNKLILVAKKGNARSEVWASVMKFFEPHEHENQILWQRFLILNHYFTKGKKILKGGRFHPYTSGNKYPHALGIHGNTPSKVFLPMLNLVPKSEHAGQQKCTLAFSVFVFIWNTTGNTGSKASCWLLSLVYGLLLTGECNIINSLTANVPQTELLHVSVNCKMFMGIHESLLLSGILRGEFPSESRTGAAESSVLSTRHRLPAAPAASDPAALPGGQRFTIPATPPGRRWIPPAESSISTEV